MKEHNISEGMNKTQRDNELMPNGTCGPTSDANALECSAIEVKVPKGKQVEDAITEILMTPEAKAYLKKIDPSAGYNPWNTSYCLVWAVNKLVGRKVAKVEEMSMEDMVFHITSMSAAIVVGTKFTDMGHFVCLVGFVTEQDEYIDAKTPHDIDGSKITHIIIDDSWGDFTTKYKSKNGNDVKLPVKDFKKLVMNGNVTKTCQVFYPNA